MRGGSDSNPLCHIDVYWLEHGTVYKSFQMSEWVVSLFSFFLLKDKHSKSVDVFCDM